MTGSKLRPAVLLAALAACAGVAAALAGGGLHITGTPATLSLPSGWSVTGASGQTRFSAVGPNGAHLAVTLGGSFPSSLPFSTFVSTETAAATKAYRAEDPHATVSGKQVTLPSGPAVQITVTVSHGGAPLAIDLYSLLHNGVTYHFTYYTDKSQLSSAVGGFTQSARSIRFS